MNTSSIPNQGIYRKCPESPYISTIFDKTGRLRAHHFGEVSELALGAEIATLLCEGENTGQNVGPDIAQSSESS